MSARVKNRTPITEARGKLHVLCVGVDDYDPTSGFAPLTVCSSDASQIYNAFREIQALDVEVSKVHQLTSKNSPSPSRGQILKAVKALANGADTDDRILFYFSGHAHQIEDAFYLVPQDAYDGSDPDSLIPFAKVIDSLGSSLAQSKFLIMDGCLSGPDMSFGGGVRAEVSDEVLGRFFVNQKDVAVLSSNSDNPLAFTKSPTPNLSLLTHFIVSALNGKSEALDQNKQLTLPSLFEYLSEAVAATCEGYGHEVGVVMEAGSGGSLFLGNYDQPLTAPGIWGPQNPNVGCIGFQDASKGAARDVLSNMTRIYSAEHTEARVNERIPQHYEERLGDYAGQLISEMEFADSQVEVEGNTVVFPDGMYSIFYEASDAKKGHFVSVIEVQNSWFQQPERIVKLLLLFRLYPEKIKVHLLESIDPTKKISGLNSKDWRIDSKLKDKVKASKSGYSIELTSNLVEFQGFSPQDLIGGGADKEKASDFAETMRLIVQ